MDSGHDQKNGRKVKGWIKRQNVVLEKSKVLNDLIQRRGALIKELGTYDQAGDQKRALAANQEMVAIDRKIFFGVTLELPANRAFQTTTGRNLAQSLKLVARRLETQGDFGSAEKALAERVQVVKTYGEPEWKITDARLDVQEVQAFAKLDRDAQARYANSVRAISKLTAHSKVDYAISALRESLKTQKELLGENQRIYATGLNNLAFALRKKGDLDEAESLYRKTLSIRRKLHGNNHPACAASLSSLAELLQDKKEFQQANALFEQAVAIEKESFGSQHPQYGRTLLRWASLQYHLGEFARSRDLLQQSAELFKQSLGEQHPDYASALDNLAQVYVRLEEPDKALLHFQQAATIRKNAGLRTMDYARNLSRMALLHKGAGEYATARGLLEESVGIYREQRATKDPQYAEILSHLGMVFINLGDYARAEPLFRQALEIRQVVLGEQHPAYANSLNDLATLNNRLCDTAKQRKLLLQALKIRKDAFGDTHPDVATTLSDLAGVARTLKNYQESESLYQQSLAIMRKNFGEKSPQLAADMLNLAGLYTAKKQYEKARPLLKESMEIAGDEQLLHKSEYLFSLGRLQLATGNSTEAERRYLKALEIQKRILGEEHSIYRRNLTNLAAVYFETGEEEKAERILRTVLPVDIENLETISSLQSERQQLMRAWTTFIHLHALLSLSLHKESLQPFAYNQLLAVKGAVTARQRMIRSASLQPELRPQFEELQRVTSRVAQLATQRVKPEHRDQWRKEIAAQLQAKERLEQLLARKSASYRESRAKISLDELQSALPTGAVLVDFVEFAYFGTSKDRQLASGRRLAAFVVRNHQPPKMINLGSAHSLHDVISIWRKSFGADAEAMAAGQQIKQQIWQPLQEYLADTKVVLVSLDGALGTFPLAALPGREKGKYLIEEVPIAAIPTPRLLLNLAKKPSVQRPSLLLVGGVNYDRGSQSAPTWEKNQSRSIHWIEKQRFNPLPGAQREVTFLAKLITKCMPDSTIESLTGTEACEERVRRLAPTANYLHFATHGFFAPPSAKNALAPNGTIALDQASPPDVVGFHPGLLSGLVFAGANDPQPEHDDGILTAEEVATLDLTRVDLAVLSACETGLGKVAGGEGVLGLQRAFQIAGARTTVTSLWKVHDQATRLLMERFYENLWQKRMGKLAALREAQLWILHGQVIQEADSRGLVTLKEDLQKDGNRVPPYYWAAFVLSGDWR